MKVLIWTGMIIVMGALFAVMGKGLVTGAIILGICIPSAIKLCEKWDNHKKDEFKKKFKNLNVEPFDIQTIDNLDSVIEYASEFKCGESLLNSSDASKIKKGNKILSRLMKEQPNLFQMFYLKDGIEENSLINAMLECETAIDVIDLEKYYDKFVKVKILGQYDYNPNELKIGNVTIKVNPFYNVKMDEYEEIHSVYGVLHGDEKYKFILDDAFLIATKENVEMIAERLEIKNTTKTLYCYKCGTKLPYDADFCYSCGTKLPDDANASNSSEKESNAE